MFSINLINITFTKTKLKIELGKIVHCEIYACSLQFSYFFSLVQTHVNFVYQILYHHLKPQNVFQSVYVLSFSFNRIQCKLRSALCL